MEILEIRSDEQKTAAAEILREGFPKVRVNWNDAFDCPPGRIGHGLLMKVEGEVQGAVLSFEREDHLGRRIVNLSSWFIRKPFRKYALRMAKRLMEDRGCTFTIVTPSEAVQVIQKRYGFRYVSKGAVASIPFLNRGRGKSDVKILPLDLEKVGSEYRKTLQDHSSRSPRIIPLMIEGGEEVCPLLLVKVTNRYWIPTARLVYAKNLETVSEGLSRLHSYLLRRHAIVMLYLPRTGPFIESRGIRKAGKGPSILAKGDIDDKDVDLLYSEYHYLRL